MNKYFRTGGARGWVFFGKDKEGRAVDLYHMAGTPIRRHVKIREDANPYDPTWDEYLAWRASGKGTTRTPHCLAHGGE